MSTALDALLLLLHHVLVVLTWPLFALLRLLCHLTKRRK